VFEKGIGPLNLVGLNGKIKKARLLSDGSEVIVKQFWNTSEFKDDVFFNFPGLDLPDDIDTVIELELI
jgi:alpha-L-fucosidase